MRRLQANRPAALSSRLAGMEALLADWFVRNARPLPWRLTNDPYEILVSEVMAQQIGLVDVYQSLSSELSA